MEKINKRLLLDPIIPVELHTECRDRILEDIIRLHSVTGIRRIFICGPGLGTKIDGFPLEIQTGQLIDNINYASEVLRPYSIEVGWWCAPFLTMGRNPYPDTHVEFRSCEFQHITGIQGDESPVAACPFDKNYQEKLGNFIREVAAATQPFMILVEDDFRLSYHRPAEWGCFCPLHLRRLNEVMGTEYSRDEIREIFSAETESITALRRTFAAVCRESMVELATAVRRKVDEVKPGLRIGICQSGTCDFDGDNSEATARAIAGGNKPFIRCWGSQYGSDDAMAIPEVIFHFMYSAMKLPDDFEVVHETDTYPHNRFFTSAAKIRSLLTLAMLNGARGSLLYLTQYLDDPLEDKGYLNIIKDYGKSFNVLLTEVPEFEPVGVQVMYSAEQDWGRAYKGKYPGVSKSVWAGVLGRFGIPYSCAESKVKFVGRDFARTLDNAAVKELLSGRVFLDGGAAELLSKRGFAEFIGAQVEPAERILCLYERLEAVSQHTQGIAGTMMYNFAISPAGKEGGGFFDLETDEDTMTVSSFIAPDGKKLGAALTMFENKLGGRVAIMAYELENNRSSSIFNYRKKEILRRVTEWLGSERLPVYVEQEPNVLCQAFKRRGGSEILAVLINLSSDLLKEVKLSFAFKPSCVQQLMPDGIWQDERFSPDDGGRTLVWTPEAPLTVSAPVILKISLHD